MAVLIIVELFSLWFAIHTLSSVRATVGAEGLWSKAQKDAVFYLSKYYRTHNEEDYRKFKHFMTVPLGDHKARVELLKADFNYDSAAAGFVQGRVHPDDVRGVINLFRRFHNVYYVNNAIRQWSRGDSLIMKLIPMGEDLHHEINSAKPSREMLEVIMEEIDPMNEQLTKLEDEFSFTLGEGSRWLENIILKLLFGVALTVEITGLLITISLSRSITKGLNAINRATTKISSGDLTQRAEVFSKDEIGQVAVALNKMTEQLITSNKELGQFAYIASHDLQEPLRSISNYVSLYQKEYSGKLEENAEKYLSAIARSTGRMQMLIKDMLDYSRIGHDNKIQQTDCGELVKELLKDMHALVTEKHATVDYKQLPIINAYTEIRTVFQNFISNALKFTKAGVPPHIVISAADQQENWLFKVSDNGIGMEEKYYDRIFIIFQRLHSQKEYAGTGIGLAHCKKIIEMHNGKVWVESEPGKGTTFLFTIPKNLKS